MVKLHVPDALLDDNNPVGYTIILVKDFMLDAVRLVRRCTKPTMNEFNDITKACGIGFLIMGVIGYVIKIMFIPINNILVGGK